MNFFIDFDNTLYDTRALTNKMLEELAIYISQVKGIKNEKIFQELKEKFNPDDIYNFLILCGYFSKKYNINYDKLQSIVERVFADGHLFVYDDVDKTLEKMKKEKHKLFILTKIGKKHEEANLYCQKLKIGGSKIKKYFNREPIITSKSKGELNLNYKDGVFIDDNPSDIKSLCEAGAERVVRIRRTSAKYSDKDLTISGVKEYSTLEEFFSSYSDCGKDKG